MVTVAPRLKVGSIPKILKEVYDVQNLTRSSSVQSNVNIMGKEAPVTILTNESGDLELSPLHIIINVNKQSTTVVILQMSLTCCLPRGMLAAECAVVLPYAY